MKNNKNKVLLITGPGGSGKTTIADLLVEKRGFIKIDGDYLDSEYFPGKSQCQWLPENAVKLKKAHNKIFKQVKKTYGNGKNNVVLDYIIFGNYQKFIERFKNEFGDNLKIVVLFPNKTEMIKRDKERECWTTGIERISAVHAEFEAIRNAIGSECFIDTTGETPYDTFEKYFKS